MAFRKEIVGSLVFILFGVGFLLYGLNYPLDQWANPGPGVFPLIVGVTLVILAAWQLLHSFWKPKPSAGREKGGEAVISAREYLQRNKGETKALIMIAVFVTLSPHGSMGRFFCLQFSICGDLQQTHEEERLEGTDCPFRRNQPVLLRDV